MSWSREDVMTEVRRVVDGWGRPVIQSPRFEDLEIGHVLFVKSGGRSFTMEVIEVESGEDAPVWTSEISDTDFFYRIRGRRRWHEENLFFETDRLKGGFVEYCGSYEL